jgi:hypothetical protein
LNNQYILEKDKVQDDKAGPAQGWVSEGRGGHKERVKEGKYDGLILYSCMKREQ